MWKSIESSPKDGREFLTRNNNQGGVLELISWNTIHGHWQSKGVAIIHLQATHWMSIPKFSIEDNKLIYIITAQTGEHDSCTEWNVTGFFDKVEAEKEKDRLQALQSKVKTKDKIFYDIEDLTFEEINVDKK